MILVTKQHVNLLQRNPPRLRNEKVHIERQNNIHSHEEEQAFQTRILEEDGKELLEDGVGDILHLRAHAHGLRADIHGEDLGGPNPGRRSPGRLVEEYEQEQAKYDGNTNWLALGAAWSIRGEEADKRDHEHGGGHAHGANEKEPSSSEAIGRPYGIEGEDDSKCGIEGVDEVDGVSVGPNLFVDGCAVGIEGALTSKLLANVLCNSS